MRLSDFNILTFDCYGTLIDWETGLLAAFAPWRKRAGVKASDEDLLSAFAAVESPVQTENPAWPYPQVLAEAFKRMTQSLGAPATAEECEAFGRSVGDWPAFADTPGALKALHRHYKLAILSNVDRASFALTNERLGIQFDAIYTAQDIGSYKPALRNFEYLIERVKKDFGIDKSEILHVAQSLYHDHVPAKKFGLATCWIDRRGAKAGSGATWEISEDVTPDWTFPTLQGLADSRAAEG
jgi:2-haloacid dehalogenase